MSETIKVSDLQKSFGNHKVLSGIDLSISKGSVYGLVGLNGTGKTTLLRILAGILKADCGFIEVAGADPWRHSSSFYSRLGIVLEHDGFWGNLTIKENLKVFSDAKKLKWHDTQRYIEEFWGDTAIARSDRKVKQLSRGQRVQCALCRAFLGWPDVVFLDEPAIALDMTAYDHFASIVRRSSQGGASIIISSHQLDTIDDLCDRVGNLSGGTLSDLENRHNCGVFRYVLSTDAGVNCEDILLQNGCREIENSEGLWRFNVAEEEKTIPAVVRMMVAAGHNIYGIHKDKAGFSDTIRSMYRAGVKAGGNR